jgi:hypothetical protein
MKRSAMLKCLERILIDLPIDVDIHSRAIQILNLLENAGMQPPAICEPTNRMHPESEFINEWDNEDG